MLHLFKLHFLAVGLYIITIAIGLVYAGSYHFVLGGNGSSTYNFGYDTNHESSDADGNKQDHGPRLMREETRLADGTVVGRYGYTDPFGVFRQVEYVAGPNGYYAYEDVGGGGGSTTLPLFFKATARQREQLAAQGARKMPGLAVLSDKFNPPLYHPEAHLADDPPVASVSVSTSSSSLDRSVDYNRLGGKPQRLSSNRNNNNNNPSDRIVSVPTSPSSSSTSSNSRFPSGSSSFNTVNASHDQRPKDGNRLPEYQNGPSNERISNPSTSPKTAFEFDYDQHALRRRAGTLSSSNPNNGNNNKDDVNTDEPVYLPEGGNDTEDLKELESYRVPTNVNVHRTSDYSKLYPSGHDDDVPESEYERSSAYSSSRTSSSVGRSLVPEAPVYRPVFSDESEEEIRPIFNRQDVPEPSNSDSPKKVRLSSSSSTYSPSSSRRSIDSNGGHSVGDNSRSSGSNVDPSSDSGIRILGSSLSSSTRIVINDTLDEIQAARLREATIPEVEILSTYGKRLSPRIDDYAESFIQYGPRVPPTFISDDIKDSNFDQIEREDDPIKLEKSIEEHSNVPENNATNDVPKPEVVTRKQLDLEDEFKIRTPSTGASPRRDSPIENAKESRISDRAPAATTTTESSLRTQRFKEATTTIAPADLSLDVTTVTSTASARIVKHPLERASSSPTVDIVRDEVIDSRGELVTSEPLYQIETTTKLADIFSSSERKASKPNGFGLDVELPTTTYAPSFDLDRSEESYDVTTATSPTKPINSPKEDEFLRIINERFFGRQSPEGPKTTVPNTPPPSQPPTTTIQTPVVTSKPSIELPSGLISEQTIPKQPQNEASKNFSGGLIAKPSSSKETLPTNDALDHYQHDSIEQEDWLHDIMKKKSLNNSLHRIETDVETPLDPNKPKKRIIKLFYKKGKLLQGQPGDHISGDIKASASGPTKVFRMRTVKLSKGFSGPILNPVQLPQEDRQHSKRHYKTEPVAPKSHEKFVENINRTQPAEIVTTTTTTQPPTTIKITTLPPASPTPPSLSGPSLRAPPPSSSFQNQPPKARRPVLRGSIGNANRSTTVIKKRKIVLAPKPNSSLNKSEQNLTKIENLELSRKNEASLISSISRSPLYVPPIMGLMDTRVGDEERKHQPLVGKLTSELVSSDVKISRSGLLHGSDSRISSLYVPPIPAGIVRGHRSAESSGSALSNIFSIIAGSSSPLAASIGSGSSSDSGHGRTSDSYLNPIYFWKR